MLANTETYSDADANYTTAITAKYERLWAKERIAHIRLQPELWNWKFLSMNSNFNLEDIKENLDLPWDWNYVPRNPNITADDVMNNLDLPWGWDEVCLMPSLSDHHIINNPNRPWNYKLVSSNVNISSDFILECVYIGDDDEAESDDGTDQPAGEELPQEMGDADEDNEDNEDDDDDSYYNYNNHTYNHTYNNHHDEDDDDYDGRSITTAYDIHYDKKNKHIRVCDWLRFSSNPSLTIDQVLNNLDLPWSWQNVVLNPSITLDDILQHLYDEYNQPTPFTQLWFTITQKVTDISYPLTHLTDYLGNPHQWKWDALSYESNNLPSITVDVLVQHKELEWDWDELSKNNNITTDDIIRTLSHNLPWNWKEISLTKEFTIDQIMVLNDLLDWKALSKNSHITLEMIQSTPQLNWSEFGLTRALPTPQLLETLIKMKKESTANEPLNNMALRLLLDNELQSRKDITIELIEANQHYSWRWYNLSITLPLEVILSAPHMRWGWASISHRNDISIDFVLNNPQYPWDYKYLSLNSSLSLDHLKAHPEIQWDYGSMEPNINFDMGGLSANEMEHALKAFIHKQIQLNHERLTLKSIQRQKPINEDLAKLIAGYL